MRDMHSPVEVKVFDFKTELDVKVHIPCHRRGMMVATRADHKLQIDMESQTLLRPLEIYIIQLNIKRRSAPCICGLPSGVLAEFPICRINHLRFSPDTASPRFTLNFRECAISHIAASNGYQIGRNRDRLRNGQFV